MGKLSMCQFGLAKMLWGPRRGQSLKFTTPFPRCSQQKNLFLTNWMHLGDLKGCMKNCSCFQCHLSSSEPKAKVSYCHSASFVRHLSSGVNFHIFDFSSESPEWNLTKLHRKQDLKLTSSTKFVFFSGWSEREKKNKMAAWPLIGWDIFDFFSETAKRISTKFYRKQDLNVLYQVCVFRADQKNNMAALASDSDWLTHFVLLLWNCWTEFNET